MRVLRPTKSRFPTQRCCYGFFNKFHIIGNIKLSSKNKKTKGHSSDNENLLQSLCGKGQLDTAIIALSGTHTSVSDKTYMALLKECIKKRNLSHAKNIYTHIVCNKSNMTSVLGGYVVLTLAKCGDVEAAVEISSTLPYRSVFSWTAIISSYVEHGSFEQAVRMYELMQKDGVEPDSHTFVSLFKACGSIADLDKGKILHVDARKNGLDSIPVVANTIISMYGKCGAVVEAEEVFLMLQERTIVSWNVMLSAYVEQGHGHKALQLYRLMHENNVLPDSLTYMFAIQACGALIENETFSVKESKVKMIAFDIVKALHVDAYRNGCLLNVFIGTTLVNVYSKCGMITEAEHVFASMLDRNAVSWTAMLSSYVEHGHGDKALWLYRGMQQKGMRPNQVTCVVSLQACSMMAENAGSVCRHSMKKIFLEIGRALHADVIRFKYATDASVCSALLTMYGKCGSLSEAEELFISIGHRNVVLWTGMLSAYVEGGHGMKAIYLYRQMQKQHVTLDVVILLCILQACSETGCVDECEQAHFVLVASGHEALPSVSATLIDAYGGGAKLLDADAVFSEIQQPNTVAWNASISGYADEGLITSFQMLESLKLTWLDPDEVTFTTILSACSYIGVVHEGLAYFESMVKDHKLNPDIKHYGIIIDLLARAGNFNKVKSMLERMPMQADIDIWLSLLGTYRTHGDLELAKKAFYQALELHPEEGALYVLMSNVCANAGVY